MKEINNRISTEDSKSGIREILKSFSSIIRWGSLSRREDSLYKMSQKEQYALQEAQKVVRKYKPNSGPKFEFHIDDANNFRKKNNYR